MDKYLLEDGTGHYQMEDGLGDYLLEQQAGAFDAASFGMTSISMLGVGH